MYPRSQLEWKLIQFTSECILREKISVAADTTATTYTNQY